MSTALRIELLLTLRTPGGDRDVRVDAHPDVTVAELCDALAGYAAATTHGVLFSDRQGRLGSSDALAGSGLRSGDVVSLSGPVAPRVPQPLGTTAPLAQLLVTGGPAAGTRVALAPGRYDVGRDPAADITIDDPSLSRSHFAVEVARDGAVLVEDLDSSNGTAVESVGLPGRTPRAVTPQHAIEAGRSTFSLEPAQHLGRDFAAGRGPTIGFNRQPRVSRGYEPPVLRLDAPPQPSRTISIPFFVAMVPLLMGIVIYLVTKSPLMLLMGAFSPIMMIGSAMGSRRSGKKDHAAQVTAFEAAAAEFTRRLDHAREQEQGERRAAAPHAADLATRAIEHLPTLWERRPADRDFLDVRLGVADQPSIVSVVFADGGDPALRHPIEERVASFKEAPIVPVLVRSTDVGTIGFVGEPRAIDPIARWAVVQHATLQSPRDVVITAALSHERASDWSWLSWLPHTQHPASPVEGEHVAVGEQDSRDLLRRIATLAAERRDEPEQRGRARRRTSIVLLVDEDVAPEATVVDDLLDGCGELDIVVLWLARERRHLPGGAGVIVEARSDRAVMDVTWTATGRKVQDASVDAISCSLAVAVARSLAPVEDTTAGGAAQSVPRSVALVDLLDLAEPTADRVVSRWRTRTGDALDALVGVGADGPFSLDLRADGPHALVAGTTGAGKSELLQTLIAALAASHPPDRIAFLLVDYKGGAAFKDCAQLPHCVGMVTDLDAHQVQRALISLNAELKRREHLLADAGARDLIELERRDPASAPPSLVIVIDEFATLAKEVPEFVDGVVDVAQRGRSLGVHLVLATQRPGNAVTDNIRANTSLRIALRVAGVPESDDVIGAPDAARLPRSVPGRALARKGPTELELFQAGYVGGLTGASTAAKRIEITGRRPTPTTTTRGGSPVLDVTDLELLVRAIDDATHDQGIAPPPAPWLPALPDAIALPDLPPVPREAGAAIGLIDQPTMQRQAAMTVDLASQGSLLIFGASGSGKTTALRTLAVALAERHDPSELQLFALDFAGLGLRPLEALPHCGSVIPGDDEERVTRLVKLMRRTIDERARRFATERVADLDAYNAKHPDAPLPRYVVLLDSYGGFTEAYERVDLGVLVDAVPRLVADGRAAGVHVIITADRRAAVPTPVASLVASRLILRMGSDDEYQMLGLGKAAASATLPPGRGFLAGGLEVQIATLTGDAEPSVETRAIEAFGDGLASRTRHRARSIEPLPESVPRSELTRASEPLTAAFAVDDLDLATVTASLADSHFVVIGPYRSGRSTALHTLAMGLSATTPGLVTHLLAPRRSSLLDQGGWDSVARGVEECESMITELLDEVLAADADADPVLLVIDDAGELSESHVASSLEMIIKRGRDAHVRIVASLETGQARHYAAWIRELRKDGRGLLLDPNLDLDGELLGARLPRRSNAVFPPGRGYVVIDGRIALVQVAQA
ncbi:MAG: FHA domain-containing protein [Solirubrobacteraceae bacterium]|nr:FHA domain-containing protein [Solirubrobacteraceae bacterium]